MAAIVAGVAGVAWAAPDRTTDHAGTAAIAIALGLVAIPIAGARTCCAPGRLAAGTLAVVGAGFGYAWTAIASKLLTDELAAGTLLVAVGWLATAAASEGLALLSEMSALQTPPGDPRGAGDVRRPGAGAGDPGAADLRGEVVDDPAAAAPPWSPSWPSRSPATTLLAGSRAVGAVIETAHATRSARAD